MALSSAEAATWCGGLACLAVMLDSAEWLYTLRHLTPSSLLMVQLAAGARGHRDKGLVARNLRDFAYLRNFVALRFVLAALCASLSVLFGGLHWTIVLVAFLQLIWMAFRVVGSDGADQMTTVVTVALAIAILTKLDTALPLYFIAAQSALAYFTAGVAKLMSRQWRSGRALTEILSCESYGERSLALTLGGHPKLALAVNHSVIFAEILMPFLLLLGTQGGIAYVLLALTFHLGCAAVMGLNNFVPAFGSALPAVAFVAAALHGWRG